MGIIGRFFNSITMLVVAIIAFILIGAFLGYALSVVILAAIAIIAFYVIFKLITSTAKVLMGILMIVFVITAFVIFIKISTGDLTLICINKDKAQVEVKNFLGSGEGLSIERSYRIKDGWDFVVRTEIPEQDPETMVIHVDCKGKVSKEENTTG